MNILTEINLLLRRLADNNRLKEEEEDLEMDDKIETKFNLLEVETDNKNEIIEDNLNIEPETADEKLKQFELYVELELQSFS